MAGVGRGALARCYVRSLALQAAWSFDAMQSVGFAFVLEPALRRIHGTGAPLRRALERHLEFFNTHPFLAAAVVGAVVRMEEEGVPAEDIRRFKNALMGPCGALGDSFFWAGAKPALVAAAAALAWLGAGWAPWAFLAVFATLGLTARAVWLVRGYRLGPAVAEALAQAGFLGKAQRLKDAAAALTGLALAAAVGRALGAEGAARWLWIGAAVSVSMVLAEGVRRGLRPEWAAVILGTACLGLGMWW